jgi:hypothetical protein
MSHRRRRDIGFYRRMRTDLSTADDTGGLETERDDLDRLLVRDVPVQLLVRALEALAQLLQQTGC